MTQAQLFKQVALAGLSGGFAIGEHLPGKAGNLKGFKIINYRAAPKSSFHSLENYLIKHLGGTPVRPLEQRARKLAGLIRSTYKNHKYIVIIIGNAHLLPKKEIKLLKRLHEIIDGPYPGIVLLGDTVSLQKKLDTLPEIKLRAASI